MLRSAYAALTACALSVVLSACGGSDDDAPVAATISLNVIEDTPITFSVPGGDPNGDSVTATIVTAPTKGDVTVTGGTTVTFSYTPHLNESGLDTFTYQVSDGNSTSNLGSATLVIGAVDDPPVIVTTLTTDEDAPVTAALISDVDGNIDGSKFTSQITTAPANGTLTVDASDPGKFTYVPNPDFSGADSFQLTASYLAADLTTATVTGTVAVTVRPVDDPPAGVTDTFRTMQGQEARFEPLANDTGFDGETPTVTITSAPSVGTATVNADGSIQYTPTAAFVGNTSLEYEVRDARGRTAHATMSIGVGLTSGILYLSRPDSFTPNELYFADGARSFKVNAALPPGESIASLAAAKSAPVAFYLTQPSGLLYRVDLRQPGVAQQVGQRSGIGEFSIDAAGSKVAYTEATALELVDFSAPDTVRDLATDARQPSMNPSGSRVHYNLSSDGSAQVITVGPDVAASDSAIQQGSAQFPVAESNATQDGAADSDPLLKRFSGAASMGPRAADGSFAVVVASGDIPPPVKDLYFLNLRDTSPQPTALTSGVIVETPTLVPNF